MPGLFFCVYVSIYRSIFYFIYFVIIYLFYLFISWCYIVYTLVPTDPLRQSDLMFQMVWNTNSLWWKILLKSLTAQKTEVYMAVFCPEKDYTRKVFRDSVSCICTSNFFPLNYFFKNMLKIFFPHCRYIFVPFLFLKHDDDSNFIC